MDIEEDIKILEKFKNNDMQRDKLERDSRCGGWKIGDIYKKLELNIAIEHILAEREEDKKKIAELEDRCKSHQKLLYEAAKVEKNSIPKQKVKEILNNRKERLLKGKRAYTNKIRINELNLISRELFGGKLNV